MTSQRMYKQLNKNPALRAALRQRGRYVAARATQRSQQAGGTATFHVVEGIRPEGRAFVNVVSDNPAEEYGTASTPRIRALGRASRER